MLSFSPNVCKLWYCVWHIFMMYVVWILSTDWILYLTIFMVFLHPSRQNAVKNVKLSSRMPFYLMFLVIRWCTNIITSHCNNQVNAIKQKEFKYNVFTTYIWCDFDCASSLICGNKMPIRCNRWFLLQILLFAQHVSGTTGRNHLYNTLELLMRGIVVPETCWASNKICNKNHLLHLVDILFPRIYYYFSCS
jgi:hypothetical protein